MTLLRDLLLRASESRLLRERLTRLRPVRRSVSRFMPGERLEDALEAGAGLRRNGLLTVFTRLGEHVQSAEEARAAADHYRRVLEEADAAGLGPEISVKLSHLGLEQDPDLAARHLETLAADAGERGGFVWVDMERSRYVDATLSVYRRVRQGREAVGICLQAYLRRTPGDLEQLLESRCSVRLVKGAYDEPADVAHPERAEVDRAFLSLARRMLESAAEQGVRHGFGTHDGTLLRRIREEAEERGLPRDAYEVQMLYGVRRGLQERLAEQGHAVRVLVSYGDEWFAWYVRRLAERPANLLFVLRSFLRG